jgi:hypothetical protein
MKKIIKRFAATFAAILTSSMIISPGASAWSGVDMSVSVFGGASNEEARAMTLDRSGNIYSTGFFTGTVDFDPGDGIANLTSLGFNDIFILKLNSDGNFLWVKHLSGTNSEAAASIAIDREGNVITSGNFAGTVDFDPGSSVANLSSIGDDDVFISKLDSSGNYIWAKSFGGSGRDSGVNLAVDNNGNICVTGIFSTTVDFDPGAGIVNHTSSGELDVFISKFDSSGSFVWGNGRGGQGRDVGQGAAFDSNGNVYSLGYFNQTVDFNPGDGTANLVSSGDNDLFISKFNSAGIFLWAQRIGSNGADGGASITFDSTGNIVFTGYFTGTVDFDPSVGVANLTSAVSGENFISKFDTSGNYLWAKRIGGSGADRGMNIAVDGSGNIYSTGYFNGTVDFDSSDGIANLTSAGGTDIFISKFDTSGNYLWAKRIGGSGADRGVNIAVDSSGNSYSSGYFSRTSGDLTVSTDFDPGDGVANFISTGGYDVYILKLNSLGEMDVLGARAAAARVAAETARVAAETARVAAETAALAAVAKQEAEKQSARADLTAAIKDAKELTLDSFAEAQIPGITASNIGEVQAELLSLPAEARTDINQVLKVARKYEVVGIIASNRVMSIQPNTFVEIGLIPQTSKNQTALALAVKKLPVEARDSLAEIQAVIKAENAVIQSRADRLAKVLARKTSRSGR